MQASLAQVRLEKNLAEQSLKERYEAQIKDRDDAIERLRDMKARGMLICKSTEVTL